MKKLNYLGTATGLIMKILDEPTPDAVYSVYEIKNGNLEELYKHLEALSNIFNNALEELKAEMKFNEICKEEEKWTN